MFAFPWKLTSCRTFFTQFFNTAYIFNDSIFWDASFSKTTLPQYKQRLFCLHSSIPLSCSFCVLIWSALKLKPSARRHASCSRVGFWIHFHATEISTLFELFRHIFFKRWVQVSENLIKSLWQSCEEDHCLILCKRIKKLLFKLALPFSI